MLTIPREDILGNRNGGKGTLLFSLILVSSNNNAAALQLLDICGVEALDRLPGLDAVDTVILAMILSGGDVARIVENFNCWELVLP